MKKLLTLLTLLVVAVSLFGQTFTIDGLEYSVLSEKNKTAQLIGVANATGDVVVPVSITLPNIGQILDILWTTQSGPDWSSAENENGNTVYTSSAINDNEYTVLRCTFRARGSISFMCRYQGENSYDYLTIGDCDVPCSRESYSTSLQNTSGTWHQIVITPTDEEEHYIEFCYSKDGSTSEAPDCAEVYLTVFEGGEYSVASISENLSFSGNTKMTSISLPESITTIRDYMFSGCTALTSVNFPKVTTVADYAFQGCSSLTSVNLPAATSIGEYAFEGCAVLEEAILPKVETIGEYAFQGTYSEEDWQYHSALKHIDISSVKTIENYAFEGCSNISSLRIGSVDQWCKVSFGEYYANPLIISSNDVDLFVGDSETPVSDLNLSNEVKTIPVFAFYGTTIKSVTASAATSVGDRSFESCSSLVSINFPVATSIGGLAFSRCHSLVSVNLPAAIYIGAEAFNCCESLEEAILPKVETIGQNAFRSTYSNEDEQYQSALRHVDLSSVKAIDSYAFYGCSNISSLRIGSVDQWCNVNYGEYEASPLQHTSQAVKLYVGDSETPAKNIVATSATSKVPDYAFYMLSGIESFSAPAATSVGNSAFSGCSALTSVNLPSATSIGDYAFSECISLAEAVLPKVETLGYHSMYNCREIVRLELPEVREIGEWALGNMHSLKYLSIPKVEKIGLCAFVNGTENIDTLHIGSVEQYCNIEHGSGDSDEWAYQKSFPWRESGKKYIFIGDSDTPATEITIPGSVQRVPEYAFLGTDIHTIHYEGTTPPALISTNSFSDWTMLAVPEEAYETYLAADVYNTIPLRITKDGHITQELEVEAKSTTSALLAKIGDTEIRNVVNLKLKGTINSYDMLIIRNRMTSLRNLDLSEASIVDCDYVYSTSNGNSYHSIKDEITGDWMSGLMNLKLPANTKTIGNSAFYGCNRLICIDIPDGVTSIGNSAFEGCNRIKYLTLPQSVTSLGRHAFNNCTGLREVVIPDGVTSINPYAFYGCKDLEKVTIPASVKNIGYYAFVKGSINNKPITLRINDINSWLDTEIDDRGGNTVAFNNVGALFIGDSNVPVGDIVIPTGTTELKRNLFSGFSCLNSVTLPDELITIGRGTFSRTGLSEVIMPKNLKYIDESAFSGCANLENIEFTDSLQTIGVYAFSDCYNLKKIELPAYLQTIGSNAFYNCGGLTEVLIPASIQEIGDYAFYGCDNLNHVIGYYRRAYYHQPEYLLNLQNRQCLFSYDFVLQVLLEHSVEPVPLGKGIRQGVC